MALWKKDVGCIVPLLAIWQQALRQRGLAGRESMGSWAAGA